MVVMNKCILTTILYAWIAFRVRAQDCSTLTSCVECLDTDGCGTWQSDNTCQASCLIQDGGCFSAENFEGQANDVICSVAANSAADAELCSNMTDCGSCIGTTLSDESTTCQWFSDGEYCGSACDMNGCGNTICVAASGTVADVNTLCKGQTCEFCLDLKCAWAPGIGCMASCDNVETNCLLGTEYSAEDICDANSDITCDGLACDFCLGVGNCAWVPDEGCVSSCEGIADARCFASLDYNASDVCVTLSTTTIPASSTAEPASTADASDSTTAEPASTTAVPASTAEPASTAIPLSVEEDPCTGLSCEECVDSSCGWVPDDGCISDCSVFDMGCFPGEVYDAYEVCDSSNLETFRPASETAMSSAAKESIVAAAAAIMILNAMIH